MPTFKNILCPVDFSSGSRHALTVATELAVAAAATLTIAHIWQPPTFGGPDFPIAPEVIQGLVDDADRLLAEWAASATGAGVAVHTRTITGVPWNEIVTLVSNAEIDLVVMGTHGRTGLKHVLIGSVAEKVVRHAPCAVLIIR